MSFSPWVDEVVRRLERLGEMRAHEGSCYGFTLEQSRQLILRARFSVSLDAQEVGIWPIHWVQV